MGSSTSCSGPGRNTCWKSLTTKWAACPVPELPGAGNPCTGPATCTVCGTISPARRVAPIYATADADTMGGAYLGMHVLDPELAIENLKELAAQRP